MGLNSGNAFPEPVVIGRTVRIDECQNAPARTGDPSISCRTGTLLLGKDNHCSGNGLPHGVYAATRVVIGHDNFEMIAAECLLVEERNTGLQGLNTIIMRDHHRYQWRRCAVIRRRMMGLL